LVSEPSVWYRKRRFWPCSVVPYPMAKQTQSIIILEESYENHSERVRQAVLTTCNLTTYTSPIFAVYVRFFRVSTANLTHFYSISIVFTLARPSLFVDIAYFFCPVVPSPDFLSSSTISRFFWSSDTLPPPDWRGDTFYCCLNFFC